MKISQTGIDMIKEFEGCRLEAYTCPAGVLTIGYGHTKGVERGMRITQSEADRLLMEDLAVYEKAVNSSCSWANQNQYDALVSFTFNCGTGNLQKLIKNRNTEEIGNALLLYNKAAGKELSGLTRRRQAERNLFFSTELPENGEYYPAYVSASVTIDIVLESIGAAKDYDQRYLNSWKKRIPIAKANDIAAYSGTASQNLYLRELALLGKLKRP